MAKKKTEERTVHRTADPNVMGLRGTVVDQAITETLDANYMPYAMSVIVSRAIPEIDGFKPSHRKLLYTMYKMGLLNGARQKSANIVGQTMKLNPHGDSAIYETMVRLATGNEALLAPFVESKGNFGKYYSGDLSYAASRYTEAKLSPICAEIFKDIDKDPVDFVDSYDGAMKEPRLLPTTFPNILVSANKGIGVAMASDICGFNLNEVCTATMHFLSDPECDLLEYMPAPDFSTGGEIIYRREEMERIFSTGLGSFQIRSRWRYLPDERIIEVYEIPYTTKTDVIIDRIGSQRGQGSKSLTSATKPTFRLAHRHRPEKRRASTLIAHGEAVPLHHAARLVLVQLQRTRRRLPARHGRARDFERVGGMARRIDPPPHELRFGQKNRPPALAARP